MELLVVQSIKLDTNNDVHPILAHVIYMKNVREKSFQPNKI